MDTSETYIKMCDCEEVQGRWETEEGDFHFSRDRLFRPLNITQVNFYKDGFALLPRDANYGWLPRQDQIQEMFVKEKFVVFEGFWDRCIDAIHEADSNGIIDYAHSMEQVWLMIYMKAIHNKIWDGEKWKKN